MSCSRAGNGHVLAAACALSRSASGPDALSYDELRAEFHRLKADARAAVGAVPAHPDDVADTAAAIGAAVAAADGLDPGRRAAAARRLALASADCPDQATLMAWQKMGDPAYLALLVERRAALAAAPVPAAEPAGTVRLPPQALDPDRAAAAWAAADPATRQAWERDGYRALGRANGLPAAVRDRANRRALAEDLAAADTAAQRAADAAAATEGRLAREQARRRADRAAAEAEALRCVSTALADADRHGTAVRLLRYDSADGGQAVVGVGDVDAARHVAVLVPGMRTTVPRSLGTLLHDASTVAAEARSLAAAHGGHDEPVAAIAWLGYRAPQNFAAAAVPRAADSGARALRADLRGLRAASDAAGAGQHITVLAHSYGSLVAGKALSGPTGVDNVAFLGSPGVGTRSADELRIDRARVYVEQASDDVIAALRRYHDPSAPGFGARMLSTGGGSGPDGRPLAPSHGHGQYYKSGSESLHNLAAVVAGRPGLATDHARGPMTDWKASRLSALAAAAKARARLRMPDPARVGATA